MMKDRTSLMIAIIVVLAVVVSAIIAVNYGTENRVYCVPEDREGEACIEVYEPVCGWFNPEKVDCIKYPCAENFGNSCFSCSNPDVLYYTKGECPE
ncbi:hypothetical protein CO038_03565 [Candidatus Pacearchaeota archaeon CG_4_9_14_0_2_um_filter_39_13]|nr:hypothetical protein [Candidatus Pacearchaeota archaeon]OIO43614.1 MAG: hypothetical protein AUJ64_02050 [Candidatus Pacearchaeota archaeon CG1_02_39_14]PJC44496.1 MAG: hypothetical protein CO038_03565 [Candidatus Pacearchaeota archaeon CG_4_9_14_0_2_um_filter_39_13]